MHAHAGNLAIACWDGCLVAFANSEKQCRHNFDGLNKPSYPNSGDFNTIGRRTGHALETSIHDGPKSSPTVGVGRVSAVSAATGGGTRAEGSDFRPRFFAAGSGASTGAGSGAFGAGWLDLPVIFCFLAAGAGAAGASASAGAAAFEAAFAPFFDIAFKD